jgi:hypothetical protein
MNDFASIYEVKGLPTDNEPMLRVYGAGKYDDGCHIELQIRTFAGITGPFSPGKRRNMIANISVPISVLKEIIAKFDK